MIKLMKDDQNSSKEKGEKKEGKSRDKKEGTRVRRTDITR